MPGKQVRRVVRIPETSFGTGRPVSGSDAVRFSLLSGRRWSRASSREEGASLVLALLFMTVMSVLIASLFYMSFTNIRSLREHRRERHLRYSGESALQLGVHRLADDQTQPDGATGQCDYGPLPSWQYEIPDEVASDRTISIGSFLSITCAAASPGALPSLAGDEARYVAISVICENWALLDGEVSCGMGSSGVSKEVAAALMMFDVDPGSDGEGGGAIVPKVLEWDLNR